MDSETTDLEFNKLKPQDSVYDVLNPGLTSHNALLGPDDVLAQFLSGDEPLEEPDLNGPTTLHCEICKKQFDNAKKYYGHLRVHSKDNLWICGEFLSGPKFYIEILLSIIIVCELLFGLMIYCIINIISTFSKYF